MTVPIVYLLENLTKKAGNMLFTQVDEMCDVSNYH